MSLEVAINKEEKTVQMDKRAVDRECKQFVFAVISIANKTNWCDTYV